MDIEATWEKSIKYCNTVIISVDNICGLILWAQGWSNVIVSDVSLFPLHCIIWLKLDGLYKIIRCSI